MTQVARLDRENFDPYFDYIKAVLGLYECLCTGRNAYAIQSMRNVFGISNNTILTIVESEHR